MCLGGWSGLDVSATPSVTLPVLCLCAVHRLYKSTQRSQCHLVYLCPSLSQELSVQANLAQLTVGVLHPPPTHSSLSLTALCVFVVVCFCLLAFLLLVKLVQLHF